MSTKKKGNLFLVKLCDFIFRCSFVKRSLEERFDSVKIDYGHKRRIRKLHRLRMLLSRVPRAYTLFTHKYLHACAQSEQRVKMLLY